MAQTHVQQAGHDTGVDCRSGPAAPSPARPTGAPVASGTSRKPVHRSDFQTADAEPGHLVQFVPSGVIRCGRASALAHAWTAQQCAAGDAPRDTVQHVLDGTRGLHPVHYRGRRCLERHVSSWSSALNGNKACMLFPFPAVDILGADLVSACSLQPSARPAQRCRAGGPTQQPFPVQTRR